MFSLIIAVFEVSRSVSCLEIFKFQDAFKLCFLCFLFQRLIQINPFHARSFLIPPENIRKPLVFCFQGVSKEISGMKWVDKARENTRCLI